MEVQENVLEKFRQGIMAVSKKKILVKSEDDSDAEEKGRMLHCQTGHLLQSLRGVICRKLQLIRNKN